MKAAILHSANTAPRCGTVDEPSVSDGQVLIDVTAAPLSPVDKLIASGTSYFGTPPSPYVPGMHGVGVTQEGVRVWFVTGAGIGGAAAGSMAERVVVTAEATHPLPPGDDITSAALGNSAIAALGALRLGGLAAGKTVIVLGANGVVGQTALQLARIAGARVVAVARGESGTQGLRELGAEVIDGSDPGKLTGALQAACPDGADLVLDPVWGLQASAALRALAPQGVLVNIGDSAGPLLSLSSALIRSRGLSVRGWSNQSRTWTEQCQLLTEVLGHVTTGELSVSSQVWELGHAEQAWNATGPGRVVIRPNPFPDRLSPIGRVRA